MFKEAYQNVVLHPTVFQSQQEQFNGEEARNPKGASQCELMPGIGLCFMTHMVCCRGIDRAVLITSDQRYLR